MIIQGSIGGSYEHSSFSCSTIVCGESYVCMSQLQIQLEFMWYSHVSVSPTHHGITAPSLRKCAPSPLFFPTIYSNIHTFIHESHVHHPQCTPPPLITHRPPLLLHLQFPPRPFSSPVQCVQPSLVLSTQGLVHRETVPVSTGHLVR